MRFLIINLIIVTTCLANIDSLTQNQNLFLRPDYVVDILKEIPKISDYHRPNFIKQIEQNAKCHPALNYYYLDFISNYYSSEINQKPALNYQAYYQYMMARYNMEKNEWIQRQSDSLLEAFKYRVTINRSVYLSLKKHKINYLPIQLDITEYPQPDSNKIDYAVYTLFSEGKGFSGYDPAVNYSSFNNSKKTEIKHYIKEYNEKIGDISRRKSKKCLNSIIDYWYLFDESDSLKYTALYSKHLHAYLENKLVLHRHSIFGTGTSKFSMKLGRQFADISQEFVNDFQIDEINYTHEYNYKYSPEYFSLGFSYQLFKSKWKSIIPFINGFGKFYFSLNEHKTSFELPTNDHFYSYDKYGLQNYVTLYEGEQTFMNNELVALPSYIFQFGVDTQLLINNPQIHIGLMEQVCLFRYQFYYLCDYSYSGRIITGSSNGAYIYSENIVEGSTGKVQVTKRVISNKLLPFVSFDINLPVGFYIDGYTVLSGNLKESKLFLNVGVQLF